MVQIFSSYPQIFVWYFRKVLDFLEPVVAVGLQMSTGALVVRPVCPQSKVVRLMGDHAAFPGAVLGSKRVTPVRGYRGIKAFLRLNISLDPNKHQRLNAITATVSTQTG